MAELITIARPYARAAFESAHGAAALPQWSRFLARAATAVRDPQLEALIGNPRVQAADLVGLLLEVATAEDGGAAAPRAGAGAGGAAAAASRTHGHAAAGGSHVVEAQCNFLTLLVHNQRLALLPEVASQYEARRAQAENVADVQVQSARELTAEQSSGLQAALERRLGRTVRLHARVDPALLGGAIVHYGDYVVDGSLRRRVERLGAAVSGA